MDKPFVVCHMLTSLDGKIDGAYMSDPGSAAARAAYGELRKFYGCQATLYGTVTMEGSYADGLAPALPAVTGPVSREDHLAPSDVKNYTGFLIKLFHQESVSGVRRFQNHQESINRRYHHGICNFE